MPKLFEKLDAEQAAATPTPVQVAAEEVKQVALNLRTQIRYGVQTLFDRAARHGMDNILDELPDIADDIRAILPKLQELWEAGSDTIPFPTLPAEPVPGYGQASGGEGGNA